jgi:hypothetical protein
MQYLDDRTDLGTVREDDLQSFEFVIVELVRIIRRLEFGTVDDKQCAAQRICVATVTDAFEAQQKPPGMIPGGFHCVRLQCGLARLAPTQHGTYGKTILGLVCTNLDYQFTFDAMRLRDTTDYEFHLFTAVY